jgi:hypothetical protein
LARVFTFFLFFLIPILILQKSIWSNGALQKLLQALFVVVLHHSQELQRGGFRFTFAAGRGTQEVSYIGMEGRYLLFRRGSNSLFCALLFFRQENVPASPGGLIMKPSGPALLPPALQEAHP